ncbi:hypothetical protein Kpol_1031p26 [Vanderwaltozyma polyspora DSM 70294]|uniref:Uncharacterized protein n=1 Tax=Vanderwaltozyma polyspora (strain ATCC 22028 / DSM 70294 / BCRC 21397 / CBS 2163 / NBRC 10782 / NRRL Y-8283 / UCD 57-17) TaxID=436907 RepID=A7THW0_VANPO|nr:uncharacterized protein Kpol_1031p26 [Vanderwaltozyma polyspora DSM 70294]EDO18122.1 hypothetical protein Kpol_1031p26 [Vanderwaltozyma polyspora DSM 70294]
MSKSKKQQQIKSTIATDPNQDTTDAIENTVDVPIQNTVDVPIQVDDNNNNNNHQETQLDTFHSPTLSQLQKYPIVQKNLNHLKNYKLFNTIFDSTVSNARKLDSYLINSQSTPLLIKNSYNWFKSGLYKIDELFSLLFLQIGLEAIISEWNNHSNRPGIWLALFYIDYLANVTNILLKEFIVKPFKLNNTLVENPSNITDNVNLPHVNELSILTKNISKDIQSKVQSDYINPTKDIAIQKYETLVKPTADKLQSEILDPTREKINAQIGKIDHLVKPTYNSAIETYQTVSTTYENNLNKTDSVTRAMVATGRDIGNLTLEKLKQATQDTKAEKQENKQN